MSRSRRVSSGRSQHRQPGGDQTWGTPVEAMDELSEYEMECYDDADNAGDPPDDSNKRKAGNGESAALKKKRQSTGSSRVRLTLEQKGQVLDLVAQKVKYSNIAKKFGCAEKTVKNFVHDQDRIRKQLEEAGSSSGLVNAKASRRPQHPEIERQVELYVKDAKDMGLAVNRTIIQNFGVKSKTDLLKMTSLSDETKARVQGFEGGIKWCRNFMSRHDIRSTRPRRDAGSAKMKETLRPPPRYSEVSAQIGFLEEMAEACGIERASAGIQMAKMAFLLAGAT